MKDFNFSFIFEAKRFFGRRNSIIVILLLLLSLAKKKPGDQLSDYRKEIQTSFSWYRCEGSVLR